MEGQQRFSLHQKKKKKVIRFSTGVYAQQQNTQLKKKTTYNIESVYKRSLYPRHFPQYSQYNSEVVSHPDKHSPSHSV